MKKVLAGLLSVLLLATLPGCGGDTGTTPDDAGSDAAAQISIKACTPFAATHPWSTGFDYFAERLAEESGGTMTVDVYYSDSLGGGNTSTIIEMVGTGACTMMVNSPLVYQAWNPNYAVFSLPFLFPDEETGFAAMESEIGQEAMGWMTEQGMTGVGLVMNGYRQLTNSKRTVTAPEDMAGLKIRIPNTNTLIDTFRTLGADPTILNMSEVYTSVQNGTVDGQENPVAVIDSNKIYEVCPYITLWTYMWDPAFVMCNTEFLESLTEEQRAIFDQCVDEMCDYIIDSLHDQEAAQIQTFKDYGCEVVELNEEQTNAFKEATAGVYDQYREVIGADIVDGFLQAIEDAQASE